MRKFLVLLATISLVTGITAAPSSALSASTVATKAKVKVPSAPTIAAISSSTVKKGKVNVKVTMTLPASNGGSKVTGSKVSAGGKTCTIAKTKTSCTIKSISKGKALSVYANSKNIKGFGAKSARVTYVAGASAWPGTPAAPAASVVADTPAAAAPAVAAPAVAVTSPGAPTIGTVTSTDTITISVPYTAPSANGSAITAYTVTSSPSVTLTLTSSATANPLTFTASFVQNTAYTFTATATNSVGTGSASSASNSVTPNALTAPGTPTIGTVTRTNNSTISVPYTAPSANGSAITAYAVTSSPSITLTRTSSATANPLTFTGSFVQGAAYTFTVTATNSVGTGSDSSASNSVTPYAATAPGTPTIGTVTRTNNSTISVPYTAPSANGSAITAYTVTSSPSITLTLTSSATANPLTFTASFVQGTAYTFTVTATNSVGTGSASSASNSVTPYAALTCAEGGTCVVGNTGPGGGIVYYVSAGFSCGLTLAATCNYLEAAPTTNGTTNKWTDVVRRWSASENSFRTVPNNAIGIDIGTGYKNSVAIVAQPGNLAANSAAVEARAYRGPNNLSDWFLPSQNELYQLYARQTEVGGFEGNLYWSSSERDFMSVHSQALNGSQSIESKGTWLYVRPVRAFGLSCAGGGACVVGDRGPGGGIVYYVSAANFTSTGSTCNTACKYLEVAPATWQTGVVENDSVNYVWSDNRTVATGQNITNASTEGNFARVTWEKENWKIGQGFSNTSLMKVTNATSTAQAKVLAYAGNSTAGQWFIPSMNELNELCKYARGQTTGVLTVACVTGSGIFKSTANAGTDLGGFVDFIYYSSSEFNELYALYQDFRDGTQDGAYKDMPGLAYVRPVRAF